MTEKGILSNVNADESPDFLRQAVENNPHSAEAWKNYLDGIRRLRRFDLIEQILELAIATNAISSREAAKTISIFLNAIGHHARAISLLEAHLAGSKPDGELAEILGAALLNFASSQLHGSNTSAGLRALERAAQVAPDNKEICQTLATVCEQISRHLQYVGNWEAAAVFAQRVAQVSPEKNALMLTREHLMKGFSLVAQGRHAEAMPHLLASITKETYASRYDIFRLLIEDFLPSGEAAVASKLLSFADFRTPANLEQLKDACQFVLYKEKNLDDTEVFCKEFIEDENLRPIVLAVLAIICWLKGNAAEAKTQLEKVIKEFPDHIVALQLLARFEQGIDPEISAPATPAYLSRSNKKLDIVLYSNCQGDPLKLILESVLGATHEVRCLFARNYEDVGAFLLHKEKDFIRNAPLAIYQPQWRKDETGKRVQAIPADFADMLSPHCIRISYPFVVNTAFWPMLRNVDSIISGKTLQALLIAGMGADEAIQLYTSGKMDFDFSERFEVSIKKLKEREQYTDVKVTDFILQNFRNRCLFTGHRHPTSPVIAEMARQVFEAMKSRGFAVDMGLLDKFCKSEIFLSSMQRLYACEYYPVDEYSIEHFGIRWTSADKCTHAQNYYIKTLRWVFDKQIPLKMDSLSYATYFGGTSAA